MADLELDFERFSVACARLDEVRARFDGARAQTHEAAAYVGHDGLAHRVREFSDGWDKRRGELSARLEELADAVQAIADTFLTLDQKIAREMTLDGAPTRGGS